MGWRCGGAAMANADGPYRPAESGGAGEESAAEESAAGGETLLTTNPPLLRPLPIWVP